MRYSQAVEVFPSEFGSHFSEVNRNDVALHGIAKRKVRRRAVAVVDTTHLIHNLSSLLPIVNASPIPFHPWLYLSLRLDFRLTLTFSIQFLASLPNVAQSILIQART